MSYNVLSIPPFDKQLKRLAKKFPSLKKTLLNLLKVQNRIPSKAHTPPGNDCYKIRLAIASKGKGKVAAQELPILLLRKITFFLLSIYDKSERQNLSDRELTESLKQVPNKDLGQRPTTTGGAVYNLLKKFYFSNWSITLSVTPV